MYGPEQEVKILLQVNQKASEEFPMEKVHNQAPPPSQTHNTPLF